MSSQIKIDTQTLMVSRTDRRGIIEYVNNDFCTISGYTSEELLYKPHSMIRHPEMPGVIFKMMWDRLKNNQDIFTVIKNVAKNGDYYWVTTQFEIRKHPYENRVGGYVAYRRGADEHIVNQISKLYAELLFIEKKDGLSASEAYLTQFLSSKKMSYDEYMEKISIKEGLFKSLLKKMAG